MKNTRMIALLLALAMLTGLFAGCGSEPEVPSGDLSPNPTEGTAAESKSEGDLGQLEGGIYTNKYVGFSVALDEKWTFAGASELQTLPDNVKELFSDTELADDMEKYTQIMDMKADNTEALYTMNVLYQKLDLPTRLSYAAMSEKVFMNAMIAQSDNMKASYAAAGIDVSNIEVVEVQFLGQTRTAIRTTATIQDSVPYYIVQIFYHQLGAYSVTLTVGSYMEDNTQAILDMFTKV